MHKSTSSLPRCSFALAPAVRSNRAGCFHAAKLGSGNPGGNSFGSRTEKRAPAGSDSGSEEISPKSCEHVVM